MAIRRTALALAAGVSTVLASTAASAVPIYESEDTNVDLYGRLAVGFLFDRDNNDDFTDAGSRIGFRANHQFAPDTFAFARAEFRFDAEQRTREDVFNDLRNTYVGVESLQYGTLTLGNFDNLVNSNVSDPVSDPYEDIGERVLSGGSLNARGRMLAYETPAFGPYAVRFGIGGKYYSGDDSASGDTEVNLHGYATGQIGQLRLAAGIDQQNEDAEGSGDVLFATSAVYQFTSDLYAGALLEFEGDLIHANGTVGYDYGMGSLFANVSFLDDDTGGNDTQFGFGGNYKFSDAMYVFAEYVNSSSADDTLAEKGLAGVDRSLVLLGARFDF